ncbi:trypsin-like peptidase domain-containing protein [bacterium]|nr:trypsin-like peptidase domain-containing protein [bacterium]
MKKICLMLMLSIGAGLALLAPLATRAEFVAPNAREVVEKVRKGVIRVQNISIAQDTASGGYGGGSGFVFEVDYDKQIAYAMTNHHVSGDAMVNAVKFWDGAEYRAELVGREPGIDVAVLRILDIPDERDLPDSEKTIIPCVLGDSDRVLIGDYAVGMGNPGSMDAIQADRSNPLEDFLLHQTATDGVVTGRDTPIEFGIGIWNQNQDDLGMQYGTNFDYAFRITVPINGGNSGGPLFNAKGEVIGINFYGGSGSIIQNYNHAIPINLAKDFATQIMNTGRFEKPWLGADIIMPQNVRNEGQYTEFKERYPSLKEGIRVYDVRADSPAQRAGLRRNDIILAADDIVFKTPEELRIYVFKQEIGHQMRLKVKRGTKTLNDPIIVEVSPKRGFDSEFSV